MSTLEDRAHDARLDRIADDQAEREAAELRAHRRGFEVGDRVRIGRGKAEWIIDRFWGDNGELASLEPVAGYSGTSVFVSRLRAVPSAEGQPAAYSSPLPIHRTEANHGIVCGTCDGGGCYDCTDPA